MKSKPLIYFCDDKPKWTEKFIANHRGQFDIETTNKSHEFKATLEDLIRKGRKPDIILIDLYHPKTDDETTLAAGDAAIDTLKADIKKAKVHILEAWSPEGFIMLEEARNLCPDIPIAIYTEQGLTLANDDELLHVANKKGEWMLKGQSPFYEGYRIRSMLANYRYESITKNALYILAAIILTAALTYSYLVERTVMNVLSFGATITSLAMGILPHITALIERNTRSRA